MSAQLDGTLWRDVRNELHDPERVVRILGLAKGAKRQAGGAIVRCPWHQEREPSCSITRGPDGTVRAKCFSCDASGDVWGLIAVVHQLPERSTDLLAIGAELAGLGDRMGADRREAPLHPVPPPPPERPRRALTHEDAQGLWLASGRVDEDEGALDYLTRRGISTRQAAAKDLVRVIPSAGLPWWAGYRGDAEVASSWYDTGHRLIVQTWDAAGRVMGVRGWRIVSGDTPKRLPPAGHSSAGLVLANSRAAMMLQGKLGAGRVVIAEGEPDWLVASLLWGDECAVFGVGSGWWTEAHAKRVPAGSDVLLATDNDEAGDRYAAGIAATLRDKCNLRRFRHG